MPCSRHPRAPRSPKLGVGMDHRLFAQNGLRDCMVTEELLDAITNVRRDGRDWGWGSFSASPSMAPTSFSAAPSMASTSMLTLALLAAASMVPMSI